MSTLQPPKKIAQKKRLREWQDWLTNFEQYYRQTKKKIPFKYIENAAWILNDLYWRIAEQYLRPVLQTKNEDEEEHRIHFYKIISASEVTIMMVLPIISNDNDDRNTRLFNAKLAWFIATSLIEGWDSGEQTKISSGDVKAIAHYKELIEPNKRYPESFAAEHVHWLSMLNVTIEKSLLINAQCWRLFYVACISMANKGNLK